MVKVYAPASSANMSVGFDVLGAAVTPVDGTLLGDNVTVEAAGQFSLQNLGRFASKLPTAPQENIVYQCWESFCREIGKTVPVAMTLENSTTRACCRPNSLPTLICSSRAGELPSSTRSAPRNSVARSNIAPFRRAPK